MHLTDEEEGGPWEEMKEVLGKDKEREQSATAERTKVLLMNPVLVC